MSESFIAVWDSPYTQFSVGYVDDDGLSPAKWGFRDAGCARDYAQQFLSYAEIVDFTEAGRGQ